MIFTTSRTTDVFWPFTTFVKEAVGSVFSRRSIIRGAKSQLFQADDAAYLLSLIAPGSPCVEIPEAEHHVMIDQPLAFVAALRGLLAGWPR